MAHRLVLYFSVTAILTQATTRRILMHAGFEESTSKQSNRINDVSMTSLALALVYDACTKSALNRRPIKNATEVNSS